MTWGNLLILIFDYLFTVCVLFKGGEYVSLGKVETIVKLMPLVDNCCVIANPIKAYCMCLITPNVKQSLEYLSSRGVRLSSDRQQDKEINNNNTNDENVLGQIVEIFDKNEKIRNEFGKEMLTHCSKQGLERFETPTKFKFVKEIWLPDSGLVTDSLKLKRKEIEKFYENDINKIYI